MILETSVFVRRSPQEVRAWLGNVSNVSRWDRAVVGLASAAPRRRVHIRFANLARSPRSVQPNQPDRMYYTIAEAEPPRGSAPQHTGSTGARFFRNAEWRFRVEPELHGSRVFCAAHFRLRLRHIFLAPAFPEMKRAIRRDLERLRRALETTRPLSAQHRPAHSSTEYPRAAFPQGRKMPLDIRGLCPLLQVYDMPTSIRFYRDVLGFELLSTSPALGEDRFHWARLGLGKAELMLNTAYEFDSERPIPADPVRSATHHDVCLYLGCPDMDLAYEQLREQIPALSPPQIAPYGMKQLYFKDPDGFGLCFQWIASPA